MKDLKKVKKGIKHIFETRTENYKKQIEKNSVEFYSNPFRF